jgi:methylase of polypeptide subunit release factors
VIHLSFFTGNQPFGPLTLLTRPPTLIPRPETEDWVIRLAKRFRPTQQCPPKQLLDIGTGSGCIPLLLCHMYPQGTLHTHGIDISPEAISLASDNAALCGIPPTNDSSDPSSTKNTFKVSLADFMDPCFTQQKFLEPPYDIITSNPPYIPTYEYQDLSREVLDWEDHKALHGGPTGLDCYHTIARLLKSRHLTHSGTILALEVGHNQAKDVEEIIRSVGTVQSSEIWVDPWGIRRAVIAQLSS